MFVDRAIPAPWALPETIETFEKSHYHWNSVVIEFLVSGCHFDVNVLLSRSTIGGGRGCNKLVPVLGGDGTKIAPPGTYLTNPLIKLVEFGASLPTM